MSANTEKTHSNSGWFGSGTLVSISSVSDLEIRDVSELPENATATAPHFIKTGWKQSKAIERAGTSNRDARRLHPAR